MKTSYFPKISSLCSLTNPGKWNSAIMLVAANSTLDELASIPKSLNFLRDSLKLNVIGCIADSVGTGGSMCSVTMCNGTIFKSDAGREYKHKSVGRWPSKNKHKQSSGSEIYTAVSQGPVFSSAVEPSEPLLRPKSIFTLSDNEPLELYQYLASSYPDSVNLGLISAQTPFLTGRPYTMMYNDSFIESGAVGISIDDTNETCATFEYDGFTSICDESTITSCKGNVILTFKSGPASNYLLDSVKAQSLASTTLYLKVSDPLKSSYNIFKVTGGDVSKGAITYMVN